MLTREIIFSWGLEDPWREQKSRIFKSQMQGDGIRGTCAEGPSQRRACLRARFYSNRSKVYAGVRLPSGATHSHTGKASSLEVEGKNESFVHLSLFPFFFFLARTSIAIKLLRVRPTLLGPLVFISFPQCR